MAKIALTVEQEHALRLFFINLRNFAGLAFAAYPDELGQALAEILQGDLTVASYAAASRPSVPSIGDLIFNSTSNELEYWNSSSWIAVASSGSTGIGNETITAGSLIKISSSVAGRYEVLGAADAAALMVGVAVTACSGVGASFVIQLVPGTITTMLSDGTGIITVGAAVAPSTTVAGRVKSGSSNIVGYNTGAAVAATLDAPVSVL